MTIVAYSNTCKNSLLALGALACFSVNAAPCCGGSSLLPSFLTGDDAAQVSAAATYESIQADVLPDGTYLPRSADNIEQTQILKWTGAFRFTDRWQLGGELPLLRRYRNMPSSEQAKVGVGDAGVALAYEFLPEFTYSAWKPKGFVFSRWVIPIGKSIYESTDPGGADNMGRGFHALAWGIVLTKTWSEWDALLSLEAHWTLPRTFHQGKLAYVFRSGWGGGAIAGLGYSPGNGAFRLGVSVSPIYEAARDVQVVGPSRTADQLAWAVAIQGNFRWNEEWTSSLIYSDQTLLGGSTNVVLGRSVSLLVLKRFPL